LEIKKVLILGIGNYLMGDDGVGVHVINLLKKEKLPEYVEVVDGGTNGLNLLNFIEGKDIVIIIDSIDLKKTPGEIIILKNEEIKKYFRLKCSVHDIGLVDLLDTATLLNILPKSIILVGVQPDKISLQTELSETVRKSVPKIIDNIKKIINA